MKLVTKKIHYAIKSLLYFGTRPGQVISVDTLTKRLKMRRPFLRGILQSLSRHRVLTSLRGKG